MKSYIAGCLALFLLVSAIDRELLGADKPTPIPIPIPIPAPKPAPAPTPSPILPKSGGTTRNGTAGSSTNNPNNPPEILEPKWQANSISAATNTATRDKKIVFVYFYFNKDREDFPANYDIKFQKLSSETYIFAKILVATDKDKNGRVFISDGNAAFFKKHKLAWSPIGVALDPYGNVMDKLPPPMAGTKIIPFLDMADKKYNGIISDLTSRYEKSDKLLIELETTPEKDKEMRKMKLIPEATKMLSSIVKTEYAGYPIIDKANKKLGELNKAGRAEYLKLMKDYAAMDKELRDPKTITPELEKISKIYKGLPVEQDIKDDMKEIKEGDIPKKVTEELEKSAVPPAAKDEPKEKDRNPEEQPGPDNK